MSWSVQSNGTSSPWCWGNAMRNRRYLVGVDLGQASDPTAIAILEARSDLSGLRLRHLERVPLGTPYPAVVERVRRITASAPLAGRCHVVVDATGGRAGQHDDLVFAVALACWGAKQALRPVP